MFVVLSRGGAGGYGNKHWSTGANRSPQQHGKDLKGEDKWYQIELKLIAQVGLLGFPNAGKSSFLTAISNARPKYRSHSFPT